MTNPATPEPGSSADPDVEAGQAPPTADDPAETVDAPKGNREAKYRTERNAARDEVAALTARIESMQRAEIERVAGEHLSAAADFWLSGNAVADYLTESGSVDVDRVSEDTALIISERPGLRKADLPTDPSQGRGNTGVVKGEPKSFAGMLK